MKEIQSTASGTWLNRNIFILLRTFWFRLGNPLTNLLHIIRLISLAFYSSCSSVSTNSNMSITANVHLCRQTASHCVYIVADFKWLLRIMLVPFNVLNMGNWLLKMVFATFALEKEIFVLWNPTFLSSDNFDQAIVIISIENNHFCIKFLCFYDFIFSDIQNHLKQKIFSRWCFNG